MVYQFLEANLIWSRKGPEPNYNDYFDMDVRRIYVCINEYYFLLLT